MVNHDHDVLPLWSKRGDHNFPEITEVVRHSGARKMHVIQKCMAY